jgi:ribose transport system substrate-binding protein
MKKKLLAAFLSTVMILGVAAGCSQESQTASNANSESGSAAAESAETSSGKTYKVVLITMDSIDQHWVSVDKGCKQAVEELQNVEYKWLAPDKKDDAQQIERVNAAIADNADAILIAANGPDAITSALEDAKSKGIKIIYVDSAAKTEAEATFATDNEAAGKLAGEQMLEALKKAGKTSGKIGIVNVNSATASVVARENGFRSAFEGTDFEILATQYSEGDAAKSQDIADNYITQGAVGLFGTNEGCTVGVGNAIKSSGKTDLIGIGFDKSDSIYSLIKDGYLLCTMAQKPEVMGYEGMKAAVAILSGKTIENKNVDTGVSVLTKDKIS